MSDFPILFKRFIDDIILGPIDFNPEIHAHILTVFNSICPAIKFTMEAPSPEEKLIFLDISISVLDKKIKYSHFQKVCHSGILLRKDSFVPRHIKTNFLKNNIRKVREHTSSETEYPNKLNEVIDKFKRNQYTSTEIEKIIQTINKDGKTNHKKNSKVDKVFNFRLPYISEACNRKIKNLINKYKLPIRIINKLGLPLHTGLNNKQDKNKYRCTDSCNICKNLQNKYSCNDRYIIYKYTCNLCHEFYVGRTCRKFNIRHKEHARSINNKNNSSALSEHLINEHSDEEGGINMYTVDFIGRRHNSRDTAITEAFYINKLQPSLNRKHELPAYNLLSHEHTSHPLFNNS